MMTVYLDICCLKRPFDDQLQPRIALETAAVLTILREVAEGRIKAVRSVAHELENSRNPDVRRAGAVGAWLQTLNTLELTPKAVVDAVRRLQTSGLGTMDAYHLAWAEYLETDVLVTTDDRFRSQAGRLGDIIKVRVIDPIALVGDLSR